MYTIDPFQKKGMSISNLTATHPPIAERIRILRAMAGASPADYERAYQQVKGGASIIPASTLGVAGAVGLRSAHPEAPPEEKAPDRIKRARETSDLMWRLDNYKTIDCECGTKLRVPPNFTSTSVKCPRCGRVHPV